MKRAISFAAAVAGIVALFGCGYFDPYAGANLGAPPPLACRLSRGEVILPENWHLIRSFLTEQAAIGISATPTADTTTISGLAGTAKWAGGVLAPNGKIYGIPLDSTSVLIIDPRTDTADTTSISGLAGTVKWAGGVLAPNGKNYGIPYDSTSVLIVDPETDTADTTGMGGLAGTVKWAGGVQAPNGKIYAMPFDSTSVLIIDPKSNGIFCESILRSAYFNRL